MRSASRHTLGDVPTISEVKADFRGAVGLIKERRRELKRLSDPVGLLDFLEVLRDATRLLMAMLPTQVSVERLFSALKLYKADLWSHLMEDILSDLLLLKCNR